MRKELEQQFPPEYAGWLDSLGEAREKLRASRPHKENFEENKILLHRLASREMFSRFVRAQRSETRGKQSASRAPGTVYLVGAGPGDPELLTVKARDCLTPPTSSSTIPWLVRRSWRLISPRAEIIDVGKRAGQKLLTQDEINSLLVSYAETNTTVVRLKGGDPSMFGRAGEELEALRRREYSLRSGAGNQRRAIGAAAAAWNFAY